MIRYVVLGFARDIAAWRRENGIPVREVVGLSTLAGDGGSRGLSLSPDVQVVTLPSWSQASQRVRAAVAQNLEIARAVYCLAN